MVSGLREPLSIPRSLVARLSLATTRDRLGKTGGADVVATADRLLVSGGEGVLCGVRLP